MITVTQLGTLGRPAEAPYDKERDLGKSCTRGQTASGGHHTETGQRPLDEKEGLRP